MPSAKPDDNRRKLLKIMGGTMFVASTPMLSACQQQRAHLGSIEAALDALDFLAALPAVRTTGVWSPAQVFTHCAQSIEFSLQGFPEHRSALFQATVGPLAADVFSALGQMRHKLSEPIPGAPELVNTPDYRPALERLRQAYAALRNHDGALHPHFAYGELGRAEHQLAQVLHLDNHLDEFVDLPDFLRL